MITEKVASLQAQLQGDDLATQVVRYWDNFDQNIRTKLAETKELREFVFATDTSTTSNSELGEFAWKNNTHLPKLAEIRDNLLAIYTATWFPNDFWMKWEAYSLDPEFQRKKSVIEGYMRTKLRLNDFEQEIEKLALDYIDYGNAFAITEFRDDRTFDDEGNVAKQGYVGGVTVRLSPEDIRFNLTASSFKDSPKVIRSLKTLGDMALLADRMEKEGDVATATKIREGIEMRGMTTSFSKEDFNKAGAYSSEGFGNYYDYLESGNVEVLEFRGTLYDYSTKTVKQDHRIQIMDRRIVIHDAPWESGLRDGGIYHVGYRSRPDNLWAMGPLDNLVGMQYRIDHLQGAKDDNIDLHLHPTKVIIGDPEETSTGPNTEIRLNEGESIQFISPDLTPMQLDNEIQYLLQLMEEFVGSPKQSRGFRTPGEKTLGEVSLLESNSNRLFLDKAVKFEKNLIEPCLNGMLDEGRRNFGHIVKESVQLFDDALGVFVMMDITEKDLQADGKLMPIGARHFGQRNQQLTNLMNIYNSGLAAKIDPHISGEAMAALVRDNLQLGRFGLIDKYSSIYEQGEAARVSMQVEKELQEEAAADTEGDIDDMIGGQDEQPI